MYTEDDKYSRHKKSKKKIVNIKQSKKFTIKKHDSQIDEDYYKDYYDDYDDVSNNNYKKDRVNTIDTTYTDDYSDGSLDTLDSSIVKKKQYIVVIILLSIVLIVLVIVLIQTINVKNPPKGGTNNYVRLFQEELELRVGEKRKLELTLSETTDDDYTINWFSVDDGIATVDNNGNVTAIKEGSTTILVAYTVDDKTYDAQCIVYVLK